MSFYKKTPFLEIIETPGEETRIILSGLAAYLVVVIGKEVGSLLLSSLVVRNVGFEIFNAILNLDEQMEEGKGQPIVTCSSGAVFKVLWLLLNLLKKTVFMTLVKSSWRILFEEILFGDKDTNGRFASLSFLLLLRAPPLL